MKILHAVQFYHPAVGGMEEVVKQLSERLVSLGHDVTVLTSKHPERKSTKLGGVKVKDFSIKGNLTLGMSGELTACEKYLISTDFDIIICFAAQQWACDIFFTNNILSRLSAKKIFVPTGFSSLYDPRYQEYFQNMKEWLHLFDFSVFLSNNYRDVNFAREAGIKNIEIIPNGASEDEFMNISNQKDNDVFNILHVGNHTGQKGHGEMMTLYSRSNISNSELLIIGKSNWKGRCYLRCKLKAVLYNLFFLIKNEKKRILIETHERKKIVQKFLLADLFLFPSNIECSPIVLFEAMASKTPFLTSVAGNAEEIISWSNGGELLPSRKDQMGRTMIDLEKSLDVFNKLCINKKKLKELSINGYQAWKHKFTWEKVTLCYENLYLKVIGASK